MHPILVVEDDPMMASFTCLLQMVDGDRSILRILIETFMKVSPELVADIQKASDIQDSKALNRAAHQLCGSVGQFTTGGLYRDLLNLERLGQEGKIQAAVPAVEKLIPKLNTLCQRLGLILAGSEIR